MYGVLVTRYGPQSVASGKWLRYALEIQRSPNYLQQICRKLFIKQSAETRGFLLGNKLRDLLSINLSRMDDVWEYSFTELN